jgi:hypothetical protein
MRKMLLVLPFLVPLAILAAYAGLFYGTLFLITHLF